MKRPSEISTIEIVFNKWIPFGNYLALTLFGKAYINTSNKSLWEKYVSNGNANIVKNHEMIHVKQAQFTDDSWLKFYWKYICEWLKNKPWRYGSEFAYFCNPFEMEAYQNELNLSYNTNKPIGTYDWVRLSRYSLNQRLSIWKDFLKSKKNSFGQYLRDASI